MAKPKGAVRSSQLVTTYGIGSIVALRDESFMVAGIDRWTVDEPDLSEPRLQRILGVRGFARPPAGEDRGDVPVVRFPGYYFCPECHRLDHHRFFGGSWQEATCASCDAPIVPARFVMVCERGHIDDFPWFNWVHAGSGRMADTKHRLSIKAGGATSSLADIEVSCICGERRNLDGAFGKGALREISRCTGGRPWLVGSEPEPCDQQPRTLQRGASNVWFSVVRSAISIPPWSEGAFRALDHHWRVLRYIPDESVLRGVITGMRLPERSGIAVDDLIEAIFRRQRQETGDEPVGDLKSQEHEALIRGKPDDGTIRQDFVCEPVDDTDPAVTEYLSKVYNVSRLREVRVLEGFTRLFPPEGGGEDRRLVRILDPEKALLPAIEVIGEGVFLELQPERLQRWEARTEIVSRAAIIQRHLADRSEQRGISVPRMITPRFLLVHTLAHALITQWALDSGYSSSALRERLYVSDDFAGILVYTATSDSAGSLGGVISQTRPERLLAGLVDAVGRASWCSADPLCIEAGSQGADALNLGACHACVLLPETSCEEMNLFLDRGMLVGTPEQPQIGYFDGWSETDWPS